MRLSTRSCAMCPAVALVLVACGGADRSMEGPIERSRAAWRSEQPPPVDAPRSNEAASHAPPPEQPVAAHYELGAIPARYGEVRWPAPPHIAREESVEGSVARRVVDRAGTRITVRGTIDELVVAADDVEILAAPGARVGHAIIERGKKRIRIAGGRYGSIELMVPAQWVPAPPVWRPEWLAQDVTIDGVEIEADDTALMVRGRRVAILNSRVRAARYSIWCGDTGDFQSEDLIIAGNRFSSAGPESTVRLVGVRHAIVVDNVLENTEKHDFRVHGVSDAVVFARNRLLNTGIMVGSMPGDRIGAVWILDNELHHQTPSLFEVAPDRVQFLAARGNRVFSDRWRCFVCDERMREGWEVRDNPVAPYRPAPASWAEAMARGQNREAGRDGAHVQRERGDRRNGR